MLLGEDFRRRHQRHLVAGSSSACKGGYSSCSPSCPLHIALNQAQHGFRLTEVVGHFVADSHLCRGREPQVGQKLRGQFFGFGAAGGLLGAQARAIAAARVDGSAVPQTPDGVAPSDGPTRALRHRRRPGADADSEWLDPAGPAYALGQLRRQPVRQAARAEQGEVLLAELAQTLLGQDLRL